MIYNMGTVYNTYIHREYNFSFSQFQVPMEGTYIRLWPEWISRGKVAKDGGPKMVLVSFSFSF